MHSQRYRDLENKVALVTGGDRGIGSGIASMLAEAGVMVALTYNTNKALAERLVDKIAQADFKKSAGCEVRGEGRGVEHNAQCTTHNTQSVKAIAVQMKAEERMSIRRAIDKVKSRFGPIDILVNNAAMSQEKPFDTITDEDWDRMMAVNLRGPFTCCQEVLPDMLQRGWGRIINISSIGGQWGGFNQVHYAAAKAGLINLTRSLARIYSKNGITANAVAPGLVNTDMAAQELQTPAGHEKVRNIPIGRIATVEEVAQAVVFLATDAASYITGQTINVNGGMYFG